MSGVKLMVLLLLSIMLQRHPVGAVRIHHSTRRLVSS
jgi:hypothetical protein